MAAEACRAASATQGSALRGTRLVAPIRVVHRHAECFARSPTSLRPPSAPGVPGRARSGVPRPRRRRGRVGRRPACLGAPEPCCRRRLGNFPDTLKVAPGPAGLRADPPGVGRGEAVGVAHGEAASQARTSARPCEVRVRDFAGSVHPTDPAPVSSSQNNAFRRTTTRATALLEK